MALTFGFYNSLAGDRKYDAVQMSKLFNGIITNGIFLSIGNKLMVRQNTGMTTVVGSGRAWFNNTWTENDSDLVLTHDVAELILNRIDAVILEIDSSDPVRANSIKIVKGTPASVPANPAMIHTTTKNQYALAYVYVAVGATSLLANVITNAVGTVATPFITGIVTSVDVATMLAQVTAQFNAWFNNIQGQLAGDIATSLQNQITNQGTTIASHTTSIANEVSLQQTHWDALQFLLNGTVLTTQHYHNYAQIQGTPSIPIANNANGTNSLGATFTLNQAAGVRQDTGLYVDLPAAGSYWVTVRVRGIITWTTGTYGYISGILYNTVLGDVANSETLCTAGSQANIASSLTTTWSIPVTTTGAQRISLYVWRRFNGTVTVSAINSDIEGRTAISWVRMS